MNVDIIHLLYKMPHKITTAEFRPPAVYVLVFLIAKRVGLTSFRYRFATKASIAISNQCHSGHFAIGGDSPQKLVSLYFQGYSYK